MSPNLLSFFRHGTAFLISAACLVALSRSILEAENDPASTAATDSALTATEAKDAIIRSAQTLWEGGSLPDARTFEAWLNKPSGATLNLLEPSSEEMGTRALAKRAAAAHLRIGWVFQCNKCSHWHANLGGAYAISKSAVATARHVLQKPDRMKSDAGYPIAVRGDHEILIISGILAADAVSDAAIVRLDAEDLEPIPLSRAAQVGDLAYCLSEPGGGRPYFSAGMVNRFTKDPDAKTADPRSLRINVSTDWAPGSSGSAVLDAFGNAIGHVGSITSLNGERKGTEAATHYMAVHWAIPAAQVLHLVDPNRFPLTPEKIPGPSVEKRNPKHLGGDSDPP
jgi:hypothetical protein